jgi:hypothetical protein
MADTDVRFSIEEARRIRDEMRKLSDELNEARRTSLRTIPDGPPFPLVLGAVMVARDIGQELPTLPTTTSENTGGYVLASLSRWATDIQAFMILVKADLWTEAYGVARMGSELAINLAWVAEGGPREHFPDADSRTTGMIHDARDAARIWFEEMRAAGATLLTPEGRPWVEVLASAKPVPHFPGSRLAPTAPPLRRRCTRSRTAANQRLCTPRQGFSARTLRGNPHFRHTSSFPTS